MFKLKRTKFDFSWGSVQDPAGELKVLPKPLNFRSLILREREGRKRKEGKEE